MITAEDSTATPTLRKKRINYAMAATLLASGFDYEQVAPQVGAKNGNVLRVCLARKGVTAAATRALPPSQIAVQQKAISIATVAADEIRERLNKELMGQVDSLASVPVRYSKLANKGQGRAAMVKTIAESFRALNGGAEMNVLIFGADSMGRGPIESQKPVIDCGTSVEQSMPETNPSSE